jgi:DNA-directed RNA polymerase subunit RPC12/RpoP
MKAARSFWVPLVLFAGAGVLALNPVPFESPVTPAAPVPAWATDPAPVRQPKLVPEYRVSVFTYQCSDCHRIIPSPQETLRTLGQHTEINLRHGLNTRCFNCHHRTQRDAFVDDMGDPIPWNQPQLVCAKCHGPVYRDWQAGSHGRINGFWDARRGPQTRRKCIECHDPHTPPFPPMRPAPGPNTLRMGPQETPRHAAEHDPLRIFAPDRAPNTSH